jgi:hypothetical protein
MLNKYTLAFTDKQALFQVDSQKRLPPRNLQIVEPFDEIIRLGVRQLVLGLLQHGLRFQEIGHAAQPVVVTVAVHLEGFSA